MSTQPHDRDQHLTDEVLSAHLDRVSPDARDHLAACGICRSRLEALSSAKRLVATPVPAVPASARSRAVAAALDEGLRSGPANTAPTWKLTVHDKLTMHDTVSWYRRPSALVGAAAAALAVALGVSLPMALAGSGSPAARSASAQRSAPREGHSAATAAPPAQPSAESPAGASEEQEAISVPDFGRLTSTAQLLSKLSDYELSQSGKSQSREYSTNSSASGSPASRFSYRPETVTPTLSQCVASMRSATHAGEYGPGLVAVATYRNQSAYVMEFWPTPTPTPTASARSVVALSSTNGCRLLARAST